MEFMKRNRNINRFANEEDSLSGVANLFDVAMIFAVGMLVGSGLRHIQYLSDACDARY